MAHTTPDDAFHEIQLNGKQLFFLFMAATIVSVVIFLCGVMVGRGVRAERGVVAEAVAQSDSPTADPQPVRSSTPAPVPSAGTDLTMVPPPPTANEASEIRPNTQPDVKTPAAKTDKVAQATPDKTVKAEKPTAPVSSVAASTAAAAQGWAVQVAALKTKSEADEQVKSLNAKGYVAYVTDPKGSSSLYRVRVGGFKTKREADATAEKIGKAMGGVTPWVAPPTP